MRCPNCNAECVDDAMFCEECGTAIRQECPKCHTILKQTAKFCSKCGSKLIAQLPLSLPHADDVADGTSKDKGEEKYQLAISCQCDDEEKYLKLLAEAAESGSAKAKYQLALSYQENNDEEKYLKLLEEAAEAGCAEAQNQLGNETSGDEQIKWYRKAAEQGNPDAQFQIGIIYFMGYGVSQNIEEGVMWLRKADQGDSYLGVAQYCKDSFNFDIYHDDPSQNTGEKQYQAALLYEGKDNELFMKLLNAAADQGYQKAYDKLLEEGARLVKNLNKI